MESVEIYILSVCPEFFDVIHVWKKSALTGLRQIRRDSRSIFKKDIPKFANLAHRTVATKVLETWGSVYEKCGAEFGEY